MEYYSAFKRKKTLLQATLWMNLKYILLGDVVKWYKPATIDKYPVISFLWYPQSSHIHKDRKQNGSGQGCGKREWDVVL